MSNKQNPANQWQWMEAGRIQEDYSFLDGLANAYKRKVLNFISLCQFKTVVFDFDGTLVEFKYDNKHLLPCRDDEIDEYIINNNFYENCVALKTMQAVLDILFPFGAEDAYILSVSLPNVKEPKLNKIKELFPVFSEDNVLQVASPSEKIDALKRIYHKHGKEIVFVEDAAKTLLNAEEELDFVTGFHISSLIP